MRGGGRVCHICSRFSLVHPPPTPIQGYVLGISDDADGVELIASSRSNLFDFQLPSGHNQINLNKVSLSRKVKITVLRQAGSTLMVCSAQGDDPHT